MPVAGLVFCLSSDASLAAEARRSLASFEHLTLGAAPEPGRLPAVLESVDPDEAKLQLHQLRGLPGVIDLLLVSVDYSDLSTVESPDLGTFNVASPGAERTQ